MDVLLRSDTETSEGIWTKFQEFPLDYEFLEVRPVIYSYSIT